MNGNSPCAFSGQEDNQFPGTVDNPNPLFDPMRVTCRTGDTPQASTRRRPALRAATARGFGEGSRTQQRNDVGQGPVRPLPNRFGTSFLANRAGWEACSDLPETQPEIVRRRCGFHGSPSQIDDFDTWKGFFDEDPVGRKQSAKGHVMLRGVDNPNEVFTRVEFDSVEDAESFRAPSVASVR